jgi:hypothetical protein
LKRAPSWSARLTRPIHLKTGRRLVTLSDARACLIAHFDKVVRSAPIAHAIELLFRAAETNGLTDRRAATAQLEIVLRSRGLKRRTGSGAARAAAPIMP